MILPMLLLTALAPRSRPRRRRPAVRTVRPARPPPPRVRRGHIDAGLKAFKRHRYSQAEIDFRKAMDAGPVQRGGRLLPRLHVLQDGRAEAPVPSRQAKSAQLFARAFELDPKFKPVWRR